jgi:hypothetical protein
MSPPCAGRRRLDHANLASGPSAEALQRRGVPLHAVAEKNPSKQDTQEWAHDNTGILKVWQIGRADVVREHADRLGFTAWPGPRLPPQAEMNSDAGVGTGTRSQEGLEVH